MCAHVCVYVFVCVCVCVCLNHDLTTEPIDIFFGMYTHPMFRSIIYYIIFTFEFEFLLGQFILKKNVCQVPNWLDIYSQN